MDHELLKQLLDNVFIQISLVLLGSLVVQFVLQQIINRLVKHAVRSHRYDSKTDEEKREKTLITMLRTAMRVVLWAAASAVILSMLHVNLAALATGAGLIGIVVGFGAQSTIGDFLAGTFIIAENQYRVGDIVTLTSGGKEISGIVEDISIRITRLRDLDGNLHILRNGATGVVTNRTFDFANVNVNIRIAYESDIDTVERVVNEVGQAMASDETWARHIKEPIAFMRVDGFEESAVRIKALGKVAPAKQWEVAGEFRRRIKKAFEQNGIIIPFPQLVIHNNK
ncbi:potassium transporter KefA [Candidatus Saccharibacteria bacterium]|nr:MAG: potassium transporter KefA [Candidatus Saccharibacteria bacterium]PID99636.1 MAG: potassium transporter KefA [Candidatus Saccharibacteria bacterium]